MPDQQYIEHFYQILLDYGYPKDRIMKNYLLENGLKVDIAILQPGLPQLPMYVIEVKPNSESGIEWLHSDQCRMLRNYNYKGFVYCAENSSLININIRWGITPRKSFPSYEELKNKWLKNRTYISKLQFENFMAFRSAEFQFGSKLNIIIGENGSGKTQLMKTIYALAQSTDHLHDNSENFSDMKTWNDVFGLTKIEHFLRHFQSQPSEKAQINGIWDENNSTTISISSTAITIGGSKNNLFVPPEVVYLPARELLSIFPNFNSLKQIYGEKWPYDKASCDVMEFLGLPLIDSQAIFCKKIIEKIEHEISGHIYLDKKIDKFVMKQGEWIAPIDIIAEGWRKLSEVLLLLNVGALYPGSLLLWDEPEANLNPKLICLAAKTIIELAKMGIQVFIATHSLFLVNELEILIAKQKIQDGIRFFNLKKEKVPQQGNTMSALKNVLLLDEEMMQSDRYMDEEV
ncbi:MAG: AAA family ATPase [Victivallales bacterium]|nr:AAA family ATPase [Victivallales bacterium]